MTAPAVAILAAPDSAELLANPEMEKEVECGLLTVVLKYLVLSQTNMTGNVPTSR